MSDPGKIIERDRVVEPARWQQSLEAAAPAEGAEAAEAEPEPALPPEEYEALREQAREEGHRAGYQAGFEEGEAAGREAVEQRAERLEQLLGHLARPLAAVDREVEDQLEQLAVVLAKQIVRRELHIQPDQIVATVREAVGMLPAAERRIEVHVHPEDAELLRTQATGGGDGAWEIVEDPSLTRGGCRVESGPASVDATLERQLGQLAARLLGDEREEEEA